MRSQPRHSDSAGRRNARSQKSPAGCLAFRGRVAIVEMRGNRWHSETAILAQGRKSIMIASELTDTILSGIRWTGTHDSVSVVEAPNSLWGQARAEPVAKCLLREVVQERRRKRDAADNLVRIRAALSCARIRSDRGHGSERRDGDRLSHNIERLDEACGWRAGRLVGYTQLIDAAVYGALAARAGAQTTLGDQHPSGR